MQTIKIKAYSSQSKLKGYYALGPLNRKVKNDEIHALCLNYELEPIGCDINKVLLSALKDKQEYTTDVIMLNRILNNGGFTEYIRLLELRCEWEKAI